MMAANKRWIVTTSGKRPLGEVQAELAQQGFAVDQVLDAIGGFTGQASDDVAQRLRQVPGIADVSPDEPIDVGPPDAPVTW